jgi:AraC-like DNA-binding protein
MLSIIDLGRRARGLKSMRGGGRTAARTAARLFVKETGLTFGEWRQQLRLLIGMQWLSQGQGVTAVALGVGYQDVSAFITAFKRAFGATPARYFRRD